MTHCLHRKKILSWVCVFLLVPSVLLYAASLNWKQRGDRFEGVVTSRDISGGYFNLVGVHMEGTGKLNPQAGRLSVQFWLPTAQKVHVKVWEPGTNYWMVPSRKKYNSGRHIYSWPATDVVKPLSLDYRRLRVLVYDSTETTVYPAALYTHPIDIGHRTYRFLFDSKGGVELQGQIIRDTGGRQVILRKFSINEDYPGIVQVRWNSRDQAGKPVKAGVLRLHIDGDIFLSDTDDYITTDIRFRHYD